jgi:DNA-binding transcriptional regulator GbsR (MarR family)
MEALAISRGNANINLHKLLDWKIVERVEMPDTRRDYYVAQKDVWELTYHILEERRQREIQPLIGRVSQIEQEVRRHADEAQRPLTQEEAEFVQNVQQMSDFLRLFEDIAQRLLPLLRQRQLLQLSGWMDLFAKPS